MTPVLATRTPHFEGRVEEAAPVVADASMIELHALARRLAASDLSILVTGETGVGKEVVAEAIHLASRRCGRPFLRLHCAAISESLLESELFGHERGAFTGAVAAKAGLLETADGGTVFLDEIGELPPSIQVKLLRVLEERQVLRVGGLRPRPLDVRFVAATNRDLEADAYRGTFRRDLYFRLSGATLAVPPLRRRPAEIEALARQFLLRACAAQDRPPADLSPEASVLLRAYAWPGNVRELRNTVERAALLCGDRVLPEHLPVDKMSAVVVVRGDPVGRTSGADGLAAEVTAFERARIVDALERAGGNQSAAAALLGIARRTLLNRLDRLDIPRPRKGRPTYRGKRTP